VAFNALTYEIDQATDMRMWELRKESRSAVAISANREMTVSWQKIACANLHPIQALIIDSQARQA
jgi:uncharacterized protein (DUF2252 family)